MSDTIQTFTSKESYRNQKTGGGVVLEFVKEKTDDAWVHSFYVVKCVEHNKFSEPMRNISLARKYVHKPWAFCEKCEKIVQKRPEWIR